MEQDFELLKSLGYDVKDQIVMCKYGKIFRGNKVIFLRLVTNVTNPIFFLTIYLFLRSTLLNATVLKVFFCLTILRE